MLLHGHTDPLEQRISNCHTVVDLFESLDSRFLAGFDLASQLVDLVKDLKSSLPLSNIVGGPVCKSCPQFRLECG